MNKGLLLTNTDWSSVLSSGIPYHFNVFYYFVFIVTKTLYSIAKLYKTGDIVIII